MTELTFILQKGEKVVGEAGRIQYSGPTLINIGTGTAIGSSLTGNTGIGTGIFSSKQVKREGSVFDAKRVHIYLTNQRIIFCHAKLSIMGGSEKSVGTPFSEINYNNIKGINSSSKLGNPAIDLSVLGSNGIDNLKFWFLGTEKTRGNERNEFINNIKKQINA